MVVSPSSPARLRENILALSTLQALNYIAPLVTVPYLVRVLGVANFGALSFAQAIVGYFDVITNYGFSLSATRAVARNRENPDALGLIFWRTVYTRAALMLASALVLAGMIMIWPRLRQDAPLYAAAFLTVAGSVVFPVWYLQGIERMKLITVAHATARALSIPALLMLVRNPHDYVRAAAIQGSVPIAAAVILIVVGAGLLPAIGPPHLSEIAALLREGWPAFIAESGLVLNAATTTTVLGLVAGNTEVGFYSAADKVIRSAGALLGPVAQALYPHLNKLKTHSLDATLRVIRKSFTWITLGGLAVSICVFVCSGQAGRILWGPGFGRAILVLRCLSPLPLLLALSNMLCVQTMLVFDMDSALSRIVLLSAAGNVLFTAVGSALLGAVGAALSAVILTALTVVFFARAVPSPHLAGLVGVSRAA